MHVLKGVSQTQLQNTCLKISSQKTLETNNYNNLEWAIQNIKLSTCLTQVQVYLLMHSKSWLHYISFSNATASLVDAVNMLKMFGMESEVIAPTCQEDQQPQWNSLQMWGFPLC